MYSEHFLLSHTTRWTLSWYLKSTIILQFLYSWWLVFAKFCIERILQMIKKYGFFKVKFSDVNGPLFYYTWTCSKRGFSGMELICQHTWKYLSSSKSVMRVQGQGYQTLPVQSWSDSGVSRMLGRKQLLLGFIVSSAATTVLVLKGEQGHWETASQGSCRT